MGISLETSRLSPFREFQFNLVPLIPYSAIAKTILVRSLIFHIFTSVEYQPLKQRLKQKDVLFLKTYHIFFIRILLFNKNT